MSTIAVNTITPASGSSVSIPAFVPDAQFGWVNKIINGDMNIAQRGTSFPAIASGAYSLDRWSFGNTSAAVATVTQQADAPSNNEFQNSYRYTVTTADNAIAAGDSAYITQPIEGYNARDLIGKTFTISFWVRSSKTGIHCIALNNGGANRAYAAEYTVNAANTWEYKTITVSGGLITAGTWNWTNGVGLYLSFTLAAGSTFQTTANAWQTGTFYATANQVNCLDTIGNIFAITGVQLEAGSVATPFEHRPYGAELALCQRYCQSFNNIRSYAAGASTSSIFSPVFLSQPLRATPTISNASLATVVRYDASAVVVTGASASVNSSSSSVVNLQWSGLGAITDNASYFASHSGLLVSEL